MTTDDNTCPPRTVAIYVNGRHYATLSRCTVPIERLQKRMISALIGDGKIMIVERDDPWPSDGYHI